MEMGLAVRDGCGEGRAVAVLIPCCGVNMVAWKFNSLCAACTQRKEKYSLHRKFESLILKANFRGIKYFDANKGKD